MKEYFYNFFFSPLCDGSLKRLFFVWSCQLKLIYHSQTTVCWVFFSNYIYIYIYIYIYPFHAASKYSGQCSLKIFPFKNSIWSINNIFLYSVICQQVTLTLFSTILFNLSLQSSCFPTVLHYNTTLFSSSLERLFEKRIKTLKKRLRYSPNDDVDNVLFKLSDLLRKLLFSLKVAKTRKKILKLNQDFKLEKKKFIKEFQEFDSGLKWKIFSLEICHQIW